MKNIKILFSAFIALALVSCNSFLDPDKDGSKQEEDVWSDYGMSFRMLNHTYTYLHNGYYHVGGAMLASATDEAVQSSVTNGIKVFYDGTWSPYKLIDNVWDNHYKAIRAINLWLENCMDIVFPVQPTITGTKDELIRTRDRMIGEAHFLRAYYYFDLLIRYGELPLILKTISIEEAQQVTKSSFDKVMEQILLDLDEAFKILPVKYVAGDEALNGYNEIKEKGRPTKGAALALKARALLYWASPLYNTNPSNKDRYKQVMDVVEQFQNLEGNEYGLMPFFDGGYEKIYVSKSDDAKYNKELIFCTKYINDNNLERNSAPIRFGGKAVLAPSQNFVDAFAMEDGTPFDWNNPAHKANPYANREPRFYMNINFDGKELTVNKHSEILETFKGGKDAVGKYDITTRTGYYLNRGCVSEATWDGGASFSSLRTWPLLRYAEVLLNYAEARNEYLPQPDAKVYDAIQQIRERAGLTNALKPNMTQAEMREVIRNERRIELAFEDHRFFDVRRWRLLDDPAAREDYLTVKGIEITYKDGAFVYEPFVVEKRKWDDKMYLYPISYTELLKAPGLTQTKGW